MRESVSISPDSGGTHQTEIISNRDAYVILSICNERETFIWENTKIKHFAIMKPRLQN